MRISVDPNTDSSGFGYVEAGSYRLRVVKATVMEGPKAPYINWEFELTDVNVKATDGKSKVGHIFEITTLKVGNNAQFALKRVCEALGIEWGEFDTDDVTGMECDTILKIGEYQGNQKNEVGKFIAVK